MLVTKIRKIAFVVTFFAAFVVFVGGISVSAMTKQVVPIITQRSEVRQEQQQEYKENTGVMRYDAIKVNQEYSYPSDEMSIVFTKLDANVSVPSLSVDKTLVEVEGEYFFGYEFTTNMKNGEFLYNLTLPNEYSATDVEVKYSEDGGDTFTDVSERIVGSRYVYLYDMNHFTIFVVVGEIDASNIVTSFSEPFDVVINEVYSTGSSDWVELYNKNAFASAPLGGWHLRSENVGILRSFTPAETISPNGYMIVELGSDLADSGDNIDLYTDIVPGGLDISKVGYKDTVSVIGADDVGTAEAGKSFGRVPDGSSDFESLNAVNSKGVPNIFGLPLEISHPDLVTQNNVNPALLGSVNKSSATIEITVDINGNNIIDTYPVDYTYGAAVDGSGNYTVDGTVKDSAGVFQTIDCVGLNFCDTIADGQYNVIINGDDGIGNTDTQIAQLSVDTTAPASNIKIQHTNDTTPEIKGCVDDSSAVLSVVLDGVEYSNAVNGPGTIDFGSVSTNPTYCQNWKLVDNVVAPLLADGMYDITVNTSDSLGNTSSNTFEDVLILDTEAPVVTLNGDAEMTLEYASSYIEQGATWTDNNDGAGDAYITKSANLGSAGVGQYTFTYWYRDEAGNVSNEVIRTINLLDTVAPVITLNGDNPMVLEYGDTYTELGASAVDNLDGSVTVAIAGVVNNSTVGMYTITYSAEDLSGNKATETRNVEIKDTIKPIINLTGNSTVTIEANSVYTDAGVTAIDNYDGDITTQVTTNNPVDTSVLGTYTITYNVIDSNGNQANEVTRTVKAVDTTKPVITLNGDAMVNIEYNSTYIDAGVTAIDNYDGDITTQVTTNNPVDTSVLGTYTITYNVSDSFGNVATEVTRVVTVEDTTKPVISLNGDAQVFVEYGDTYTELNASATDNYDGDITTQISITGSVDNTNLGTYTIKYNVTDSNGNQANEVTRTVVVRDTTKPVLTIEKDVEVGPVQEDEVSAKAVDLKLDKIEYSLISDASSCATVTIGEGQSYTSESVLAFGTEENNGNYVCFVAVDTTGNSGYAVSTNSLDIDTTPPNLVMQNIAREEGDTSDLTSDSFIVEQESGLVPQCTTLQFDNLVVDQPRSEDTYTVDCTLTDLAGNKTEKSSILTVTNNEQRVYIIANPSVNVTAFQNTTLTASVKDGNPDYTYQWNGECSGTSSTASLSLPVGEYTCGLNVKDSDGDDAYASVKIVVTSSDSVVDVEADDNDSEQSAADEDNVISNFAECVANDGLVSGDNSDVCVYEGITYTSEIVANDSSSDDQSNVATITTYAECVDAGGFVNPAYLNICEINNQQYVSQVQNTNIESNDAAVLGASDTKKSFPYWVLAGLGVALIALVYSVAVSQHKKDKVNWY